MQYHQTMKLRQYGPRNFVYLMMLLILCITLSSCAEVTPIENCITDPPCGFLSGAWHGLIAPFSFFGSLFSDDIALYAVNNNGGWYDFGFVLGAGILFGGGSKAGRRKK